MTNLFDYRKTAGDVMNKLGSVHVDIDNLGLEKKLQHLVLLRASQINGCGFCVKMHTTEARRDGETNERLDRLIVWRHVDDFTPKEKAAFAWTEALTELHKQTDLGPLREDLVHNFNAEEIGALTTLIGMINLWNRVQISVY